MGNRKCLALVWTVLFLGPARSMASTGGDSGVGSFCLESAGERVLFFHSEGGGSGCWDTLMSLDLASGTRVPAVPCGEEHEEERRKALVGCEPLVERSLESLGLRGRVAAPPEKPKVVVASDLPAIPDLFRPVPNLKLLTIHRGKRVLGSVRVSVCAFSATDSRPRTASLRAHGFPGKRFVLLTVSTLSVCYESTYHSTELLLLQEGWAHDAKAPPEITETVVPLGLTPTDFAQAWNDAGMTLYRAGRLRDAAAYFEFAYDVPLAKGKGRHLLALFNRAAVLAKLNEREESLAAIAVLLSYEKDRARYRKKIRADPDFAELQGDERLRALLADPDCCADRVEDRSEGQAPRRSRREYRWREGEQIVHFEQEWMAGVLLRERTPTSHREWYLWDFVQGGLRVESHIKNGTGWSRTYYEDGTLDDETHFLDGKVVPLPKATGADLFAFRSRVIGVREEATTWWADIEVRGPDSAEAEDLCLSLTGREAFASGSFRPTYFDEHRMLETCVSSPLPDMGSHRGWLLETRRPTGAPEGAGSRDTNAAFNVDFRRTWLVADKAACESLKSRLVTSQALMGSDPARVWLDSAIADQSVKTTTVCAEAPDSEACKFAQEMLKRLRDREPPAEPPLLGQPGCRPNGG